jgi:hypothetical protein
VKPQCGAVPQIRAGRPRPASAVDGPASGRSGLSSDLPAAQLHLVDTTWHAPQFRPTRHHLPPPVRLALLSKSITAARSMAVPFINMIRLVATGLRGRTHHDDSHRTDSNRHPRLALRSQIATALARRPGGSWQNPSPPSPTASCTSRCGSPSKHCTRSWRRSSARRTCWHKRRTRRTIGLRIPAGSTSEIRSRTDRDAFRIHTGFTGWIRRGAIARSCP